VVVDDKSPDMIGILAAKIDDSDASKPRVESGAALSG